MEKETKVPAEDPKIDLFEDDDEFEEFEINEGLFLLYPVFWYFFYNSSYLFTILVIILWSVMCIQYTTVSIGSWMEWLWLLSLNIMELLAKDKQVSNISLEI